MQPTTTNILAIDNILTRVGDEAAREPFALSAVYADAAARAAVKAAPTGSADYAARWATNMGDLGWRLSAATNVSFGLSARAPHPTLADLLAATDSTAAALLATVRQRAGRPSAGLDWWWDWVGKPDGALSLGFAACDDQGGPCFTATFFTVATAALLQPRTRLLVPPRPVDTTTWAALLVPLAAAPGDIGLRQFTATLDVERFAAGESQVRAALGQKFAAHYHPVD